MKNTIGWGTTKDGTLLVNLSGGIDSTYALWVALKQGRKCIVHHIVLNNRQRRAEREEKAVTDIMLWLTDQGLNNWEYLESVTDFGQITRSRDVTVWGWWTGVILRKRPQIKQVLVPTYRVDSPEYHDKILQGLVKLIANRDDVEFLFPLAALKKKDVVRSLIPKDLLALTWYCRQPTPKGTCNKCHTCKEVHDAMRGK